MNMTQEGKQIGLEHSVSGLSRSVCPLVLQ